MPVEAAAAEVVEEAAPAPEVASEAESEGADWDALDLDEIALPGQKSAKEVAAEKVLPRPCSTLSALEGSGCRVGLCES